jgi:SAM-dependent methyltransferase
MKKYIIGWIVFKLVLLGIFAFFAFSNFQSLQLAQSPVVPTPTPDDRIDRPTSNPYRGDLARFDRENRAEKLQIEKVMDLLNITPGQKVADIGAGGGWFTVIAAKRVGEKGSVYAVDINEESATYINERAKKEKITNIKTIINKEDDPLLPEKSINSVLILNTYHEIAEPIIFLKNLRKSLKKDALVGIIDRNGDGGDHGIDSSRVIKEAKLSGFTIKGQYDFVKEGRMDYFLVFELTKTKN